MDDNKFGNYNPTAHNSDKGKICSCASPYVQSLFMGLVFFLNFMAYDTIQVYAKKTYPSNLGTDMVMAVYIAFTLCCFVSPVIVNIIGSRVSMFLGILGYSTLVVGSLIFFKTGKSRELLLACGSVLGLGAGLLWVGQGRLILDYTNDHNRGVVFSIFWAWYRAASLFGGILSFTYFSIKGNSGGSTSLYLVFLGLMITAALATLLLRDAVSVDGSSAQALASIGRTKYTVTLVAECKSMAKLLKQPEAYLLFFMFWGSGANEPYALNTFTRFFDKKTTGLGMVVFFSGTMLGALLCGKLLDRFPIQQLTKGVAIILTFFSVIHYIAFALAFYVERSHWPENLSYHEARVIVPLVAFFLWGFSDAMINTFLYWLIGCLHQESEFKARMVGLFKLLNSAAHIVAYYMVPVDRVAGWIQLATNIAIYTLGVASLVCLFPTMQAAVQVATAEKRRSESLNVPLVH